MKLQKSLAAVAFLLLCGVGALGATERAAGSSAASEDLFGVSVLSLPADCWLADEPGSGKTKSNTATGGGLDRSTCGGCSVPVCRFRPVGWLCGVQSGNPKFCQDTYGDVCEDGGAYCRCTDTIVP
jgi:hypothetical protein